MGAEGVMRREVAAGSGATARLILQVQRGRAPEGEADALPLCGAAKPDALPSCRVEGEGAGRAVPAREGAGAAPSPFGILERPGAVPAILRQQVQLAGPVQEPVASPTMLASPTWPRTGSVSEQADSRSSNGRSNRMCGRLRAVEERGKRPAPRARPLIPDDTYKPFPGSLPNPVRERVQEVAQECSGQGQHGLAAPSGEPPPPALTARGDRKMIRMVGLVKRGNGMVHDANSSG